MIAGPKCSEVQTLVFFSDILFYLVFSYCDRNFDADYFFSFARRSLYINPILVLLSPLFTPFGGKQVGG